VQIQLPYGHSSLMGQIPDGIDVDIISPQRVSAQEDPLACVRMAVQTLLGNVAWEDFIGAKSVAIAVNDKTRPVPHDVLLPPLLAHLARLGLDEAITIYVAVGTHPPMQPEEFPGILSTEILKRYRVVSHDSENPNKLVFLGETSHGTPVWTNREYYESDLKIVVGNIEPHQFAGFSGGVKTAAVGLAGLESINNNHGLMIHPNSQLGKYEINPTRQDIEEMGQMIGIHVALNAILNQEKKIVHALAGDPVEVMKAGIPLSRQVCQVRVPGEYKLVIASPGGHPKDINVYQAQKALAHAALVSKPTGTIILVAACPEGAGSPHYEHWMRGKNSYAEVLERFNKEGFRIGPHKAFMIARDATKSRLLLVSEMDQDLAGRLLLNPVENLQAAIDTALRDFQAGDRVGIMTHASSTIPFIEI